MLRVAEQYATTDTGRQRRANEDSLLARSPLFVVADGMGGAQAGEVASKIAVEVFEPGLGDSAEPEADLATRALAANARIHELSHSSAEHAGMGTTLTAVYVAPAEVAIAHVGDSRAYRLREGELSRLTDDHSLVDELLRQGKITPEEAVDHPQRSVITRALGPEPAVEIDTRSYAARAGDVYLLCSDGLTTMLPERRLSEILRANPRLRDAGEALVAAANEAGGRDNITVVLFRLRDTDAPGDSAPAAAADPDPETEEQSVLSGSFESDAAPAELSPRLSRGPHGSRRAARAVRRVRHRARAAVSDRAPAAPAHARPGRGAGPGAWQAADQARGRSGDRAGGARPDRLGRVSGARVGVLHRHQLARPGHAVSRGAVSAARSDHAVQHRIRHGRERLDADARAATDIARPFAALGRRCGRSAAQPGTGTAR